MGMARQARRIARNWATALGATAGITAVEDFQISAGMSGEDDNEVVASLAETIAPGQESWDTAAVNAGAAKIDRCPAGYEDAYYAAYDLAARARVLELTN